MTNDVFRKLAIGNILTTTSGVNKYMVTHVEKDSLGDVVAIAMERAAQIVDCAGYDLIQQESLVSVVEEKTVLGAGK